MLFAAAIACAVLTVVGLLLVLALTVYLRGRTRTPASDSPCSDQGEQVASDVEVIILDETLQLNNFGDCSVRLEGTGVGESALLYPTDLWMRKFDPRRSCVFHLYFILNNDQFEERFLEIKVTAGDVSIRPITPARSLYFSIWKLKPAVYMQTTHVMEHKIFNGQLLKTVNFSRAPGRYYKIRASTRQRPAGALMSGSNIDCGVLGGAGRLQLLSVRVETEKALAMNSSNRLIKASIVHPTTGDVLNRRLSAKMQEVPANGVCTFAIRPSRSACYKDLLRVRLTEHLVAIEPPAQFGSLPLYCDIHLVGGAPVQSKRIVSAEVLSELQLPRRAHTYVLAFSVALGDEEGLRDGGDTSRTLD